MQRVRVWSLTLVVMCLLAACGSAAPKVDWTLKVEGAVSSPLSVSYADLAGMTQTELSEVLMDKSLGEDTHGSWSGVSLAELLAQAGAGSGLKSVTAVAADGYAIEINKEEMQDAIVALQENGEWIATADAEHGPIRLVCPHVPANRWVFQLQAIQVNE